MAERSGDAYESWTGRARQRVRVSVPAGAPALAPGAARALLAVLLAADECEHDVTPRRDDRLDGDERSA